MLITQGYINDGNVEDIEKQLNSSLRLGFGEKDAVQPYYSDLVNKFFTKLSLYQLPKNKKQFNISSPFTIKLTSIPSADAFNHVSFVEESLTL
jgi:hypothetical protein